MIVRIGKLLRKAAWPGMCVFVAHMPLAKLFGHEPYVDPVMHLLGGVAAAFFFSRLGPFVPAVFGSLAIPARRTLAFCATTTVAVLWELAEYLSDRYLGTMAHTNVDSTLRDILTGMLGALAYLVIEWSLQWKTGGKP